MGRFRKKKKDQRSLIGDYDYIPCYSCGKVNWVSKLALDYGHCENCGAYNLGR